MQEWYQFLDEFGIVLDSMELSKKNYVVILEFRQDVVLRTLVVRFDILHENRFHLWVNRLRWLRSADCGANQEGQGDESRGFHFVFPYL
jgi:hypothetical protein